MARFYLQYATITSFQIPYIQYPSIPYYIVKLQKSFLCNPHKLLHSLRNWILAIAMFRNFRIPSCSPESSTFKMSLLVTQCSPVLSVALVASMFRARFVGQAIKLKAKRSSETSLDFTRLHGFTTQKTVLLVVTAVWTSFWSSENEAVREEYFIKRHCYLPAIWWKTL
jgi:hypothetical protein